MAASLRALGSACSTSCSASRRLHSLCAPTRAARCSRQRTVAARAYATTSTSNGKVEVMVVERVLRYPDGVERRILYPVLDEERPAPAPAPAEELMAYGDEDGAVAWLSESDVDEVGTWNECNLAGAACHVLDADPLVEELAARQAGPKPHNLTELVRSSYKIMDGSPWLVARPLYVLAQQSMFGEHGMLYSLQARMEQQESMDELARIVGHPDLSHRLAYAKMRDGVLSFDRAEDAARYATWLEAELQGQPVEVMEVDSHQLFTLTGGSDAVVVHIPASDFLPTPVQLMQSLRQ